MSLKDRITSDLTAAMKAQDASRLSTLRMIKAAVQNREIEKGAPLTDDELTRLFQSLVKQRRDSVEQYQKGNRPELGAEFTVALGFGIVYGLGAILFGWEPEMFAGLRVLLYVTALAAAIGGFTL